MKILWLAIKQKERPLLIALGSLGMVRIRLLQGFKSGVTIRIQLWRCVAWYSDIKKMEVISLILERSNCAKISFEIALSIVGRTWLWCAINGVANLKYWACYFILHAIDHNYIDVFYCGVWTLFILREYGSYKTKRTHNASRALSLHEEVLIEIPEKLENIVIQIFGVEA